MMHQLRFDLSDHGHAGPATRSAKGRNECQQVVARPALSVKSAEHGMVVKAGGEIATIISLSKAKVGVNINVAASVLQHRMKSLRK